MTQDPGSEKKLLLALALSLIVLFTFQIFYKPAPRKGISPPATTAAMQNMAQGARGAAQTTSSGMISQQQKSIDRAGEKQETIGTDHNDYVFSNLGGSLTKISLKEYKNKGQEEVLYSEDDPAKRIMSIQNTLVPGIDTRKYEQRIGKDFVEYKMTEPGLFEVTKRYDVRKSLDYIDLSVQIKNISSKELNFSYNMVGASGINGTDSTGKSVQIAEALVDDKIWREKAVKAEKAKTGNIAWIGMKNQYFALLLKPSKNINTAFIGSYGKQNLLISIDAGTQTLAPGATVTDSYKLYAGPLDEKRISALGEDAKAIVDYGFFGGVSKVLLSTLRWLHHWTGSWGIAIILLTLAINILLFPLTVKSFTSMHQMKKIQPHVEKLKELHKDNHQKLQKETMELYKKYNVNPLGGCLPLLLQMPIFIALYSALMNTIDLKGGKFLWIKDLSRPDAVPLPFSLPVIGNTINILPLLMAIGMFAQQKISQGMSAGTMTEEQASQQKMMMIMFPLLFGFMFYNMPSGLVLYWLTNTVLMTAEQSLISRRLS